MWGGAVSAARPMDPRRYPLSQAKHTRTANRRCARCDKPFYAAPSRIAKSPGGGRHCSRACQSGWQVRICERCGIEFRITAHLLSRGYGTYCSATCRSKRTGQCSFEGCQSEIVWVDMCRVHYARRTQMRIRYGLTLEEASELCAAGCAICGARPEGNGFQRGLHIDHDHDSGVVRGALCHGCNTGLGSFADDPARLRAAVKYLESHR